MKTSTIYLFWFIFIVILLSGCQTRSKWQQKGLNKGWAASFCSSEFPVALIDSSTIIDSVRRANNKDWTEYLDSLDRAGKGQFNPPVLPPQTGLSDCRDLYEKAVKRGNDLASAINRLRSEYVKCLPDTQYIRTTVRIRDMAMETALRDSLRSEQDRLIKVTEQRDNRTRQRNGLAVMVLILSGLIILRLMKKI